MSKIDSATNIIFSSNGLYNIGIEHKFIEHHHQKAMVNILRSTNFNIDDYTKFVGTGKDWFLPIECHSLFNGDITIELDNSIKQDIIESKCVVLFCELTEPIFDHSQYEKIYSVIDNNGIPASQCVIVCGAHGSRLYHDKYAAGRTDVVHIAGDTKAMIHLYTSVPSIKDKRFLFLSRHPKPWCFYFAYKLSTNKHIKEQLHISFSIQNPYTGELPVTDQFVEQAMRMFNCSVEENVESFVKQLPLILDTESFTQSDTCGNTSQDIFLYYHHSDIVIVRETRYDSMEQFITEKTLKAIAMKKPFIVIGNPLILFKLRELGFKTFSPWFNEDYDLEANRVARADKIINLVEEIASMTNHEVKRMIADMYPVIEHNYNHLQHLTMDTTWELRYE